jgi:hypothetical protein
VREVGGDCRVGVMPAPQAEEPAAAARHDGAPGRHGSRGRPGVSWAELRVALWLSVVCAVTAGLLAVPAGVGVFVITDQLGRILGRGVFWEQTFRDVERMHRLEPFTIDVDLNSTSRRLQRELARCFEKMVVLLFLPLCYVAYFKARGRACRALIGSAVLAYAISLVAYVIFGSDAFLAYYAVLGFALQIVALKLVCPRNSKVPTQAIKQALVGIVGNMLLMNVIAERTVRQTSCNVTCALAPADLTPPLFLHCAGPGSLPADVRTAQPLQGSGQVLLGLCRVLPYCDGHRDR